MSVLVISTHPDDETLGCGGTLLTHQANGVPISWLIATRGHTPQWSEETINRKAAEIERVAQAYGVSRVEHLGFPTVLLDTVPQAEIMDAIREVVASVQPRLVYLVHRGDVHSDHRFVFDATLAVLKPFLMHRLGVERILSYETLSSTDAASVGTYPPFEPNVFHEITPYLERKLEIMGLYETEAQRDPMPRGPSAITALARHRGATVGVQYAEAFVLVREVTRCC